MSPSLKAKSEAGAEAKPEAIPISEERHKTSTNTNFFITALVDVCLLMQIPEKGKQLFPVSFVKEGAPGGGGVVLDPVDDFLVGHLIINAVVFPMVNSLLEFFKRKLIFAKSMNPERNIRKTLGIIGKGWI